MSAEISEIAARWAVRIDRGLTDKEDAELQRWRASDPRCEGALIRAHALFLRYDRAQALGPQFSPADFGGRGSFRPSRRTLLYGAGGAVGVMAAGLAAFELVAITAAKPYASRRGEVRMVALSDGSSMTLNSASKVVVRYSKSARDLKLVSGEALFDVAKNRRRPFIVDAGDLKVRAVGTSFSVRKIDGEPTQVVVREGVVDIIRATEAEAVTAQNDPPLLRLAANHVATAATSGAVSAEALTPTDLSALLAWKEGMISFKHTTLKDAAAEFARYSDTPIVLDDPEVADQKITGLYAAANPVGFAQAVAESLDLRSRVEAGAIHLSK